MKTIYVEKNVRCVTMKWKMSTTFRNMAANVLWRTNSASFDMVNMITDTIKHRLHNTNWNWSCTEIKPFLKDKFVIIARHQTNYSERRIIFIVIFSIILLTNFPFVSGFHRSMHARFLISSSRTWNFIPTLRQF